MSTQTEAPKKKSQMMLDMEGLAFTGNWEAFKSYHAPNIRFRVGTVADEHGPEAVAAWLIEMLTNRLAIYDAKVRGVFDADDDTVVLELDIKAKRIKDGKDVSFPCLDVYKFDANGKICDWRVFPMETTIVN